MRRPALFLSAMLLLSACGQKPAAQDDLESLDRELTAANAGGPARDPALTASLADQIMVDPALAQSSNANAIRPPARPDSGAAPDEAIAAKPDTVDGKTLKTAPAASGDCSECRAAQGALTLGALAGRQGDARVAGCSAGVGYANGWANRLPADLPLYPDARVAEAAGSDANGCALRIVSFASGAPVQRLLDWYHTQGLAAGYATGHRAEGAQHVLAGKRGGDAFIAYVSARAGGGSSVDFVSNAGR